MSDCVYPSAACRRLEHPTLSVQVNGAGDHVDICRLCTLAYRTVLSTGETVSTADAVVQRLRAELEPYRPTEGG